MGVACANSVVSDDESNKSCEVNWDVLTFEYLLSRENWLFDVGRGWCVDDTAVFFFSYFFSTVSINISYSTVRMSC